MIAPVKSIPNNLGQTPQTPSVEDVLPELRLLNESNPQIIGLETRKIRRALIRRGVRADLATVESAVGWLVVDELEITA